MATWTRRSQACLVEILWAGISKD